MRGWPNLHIITIHEIINYNNKTIENPNICYLSQHLDSTKLTDIMRTKAFEYIHACTSGQKNSYLLNLSIEQV